MSERETQNMGLLSRATTGELGIFLIWVFCRRPQFSCLIRDPPSPQAPPELTPGPSRLCLAIGPV